MANRFPLIFNSGAGQIQELAASDNLDLTSSNLVNAGILFTSSGSATAPSLQIGSGTTYNPGLYSPGTDQLAVSTGGVGRLFIDASGNMGLGTSPFSGLIDAKQSSSGANVAFRFRNTATTAGSTTTIDLSEDGAGRSVWRYSPNTGDTFFGSVDAGAYNLRLYTNANERLRITSTGTLNFKGAGTAGSTQAVSFDGSAPVNSMVLDSSGRLGIGTSEPGSPLHVVGNSKLAGNVDVGTTASAAIVQFPAVTGWGPRIAQSGSSINALGFFTNNTETLTLTNGGLLGIGNTGPNAKLHITGGAGSSSGTEANLAVTSSTPASVPATISSLNSDATLQIFAGGLESGSSRGGQIDFKGGAAASDAGTILFRTGIVIGGTSQTEKARIRSDGMFEVKGAGTSGSSPAFSVNGSAPANSAIIDTSGRLLVGTVTTSTNTNTKLVIQQNNAPRSTGGPEAGLFLTTSSNGYALQAGAYDSGSLATSYTWISSVRSNDAYYDGPALPPLVFLIADQECMRIKANGDVSIVTGNLIIGTSGKGIDFSADGSAAGMTSELLDDYEEGTWTPTQGAGLTVVGTFTSNGHYTKIGRHVTVQGYVAGSTSVAATANTVMCGGLPFAVMNVTGSNFIGSASNANLTALINVWANQSLAVLYAVTSMAATGGMYFTASYFTA